MSDTIIQVENLSKKYIIGHQKQEKYTALRDVIANTAKSLGQKLVKPLGNKVNDPAVEEFWALQDVSFEVKQGDRVGIIGRNGAGKSTLLKILSRITEPTKGRVRIKGRVASLLEVGTGFHPELTGRENIFLNGAILGMSKVEIKRKFDEIVDFAEVEKFLDTPVKRYSSGMYVRLAFAVAAHLEPEILVVDEVLAVGDAQFQKKCLGKMEDVGKEGRTVLFVSHQMPAIQKLCSRAVLLDKGNLIFDDNPEKCITQYLQAGDICFENGLAYTVNWDLLRKNNSEVSIKDIALLSDSEEPATLIQTGDPLILRIYYKTSSESSKASLAFVVSLKSSQGQEIFRLSTMPISGYQIDELGSEGSIDLKIESLPIVAGRYFFDIGVTQPRVKIIFKFEELIVFDIQPRDIYQSGFSLTSSQGIITIPHKWSHYPQCNPATFY